MEHMNIDSTWLFEKTKTGKIFLNDFAEFGPGINLDQFSRMSLNVRQDIPTCDTIIYIKIVKAPFNPSSFFAIFYLRIKDF